MTVPGGKMVKWTPEESELLEELKGEGREDDIRALKHIIRSRTKEMKAVTIKSSYEKTGSSIAEKTLRAAGAKR
jgi:hypothetical protein